MSRKFRCTIEGKFLDCEFPVTFVKVDQNQSNIDTGPVIVTIYDCSEEKKDILINRIDTKCYFKLTLYDGCGTALEQWELENAYIFDLSGFRSEDISLNIYYEKSIYKLILEKQKIAPSKIWNMGTCPWQKITCPNCFHEFSKPGFYLT